MKAIATHALVVIGARQGVGVIDEGMAAMESGVEARDLRRRRKSFHRRFDARDIVRLVEGRKRDERFQLRKRGVVDQNRLGIIRPSVHDAMANRGDRRIVARLLQPVENGAHRPFVIDACVRLVETELDGIARGCLHVAFRGRADALDLAGGQQVRLALLSRPKAANLSDDEPALSVRITESKMRHPAASTTIVRPALSTQSSWSCASAQETSRAR